MTIAVLRDKPVGCPAGSEHGAGVYCRVEHSFIDYEGNPGSIAGFCKGRYTQCPSWRAEKENEWAQRNAVSYKPLVPADHEHQPVRRRPAAVEGALAVVHEQLEGQGGSG